MQRFVLLLFCTSLLFTLAACGSDDSPAEAPKTNLEAKSGTSYESDPVPVPSVTLETMDGHEINLADQQGKVLLVNFWATWCAPCRKEIPDLIDLHAELNAQGLTVIGVALDNEGSEVVKPYVKEQNINYPIVIDANHTVEAQFGSTYGLPTTYVVNPQGQIVRRIIGIFPTEEMKPTLKKMLRSKS